jgi:hypothetical protein
MPCNACNPLSYNDDISRRKQVNALKTPRISPDNPRRSFLLVSDRYKRTKGVSFRRSGAKIILIENSRKVDVDEHLGRFCWWRLSPITTMAKKRKISNHHSKEPKPLDVQDGKLGPIRTYEDVADPEDEFHINRDKILLDDGPDAKRRKRWEEEGMWYLLWWDQLFTNWLKMLGLSPQTKKS